jgi:FKBP-type peptidyl-prolyl cis-trans isomerase (trigger factor)
MKVKQSDDNDGRKVLQIEAPWAEIEADYRDLVSQYAKVRVPGFRPGKAPRPVIEQRFQKEIMEAFSARITERFSLEAVRETGVETLGPIEATEIDCTKGQPFRARVRYIPMPEIELPDLGSLAAGDDSLDPRDRISRRLLEEVAFDVPDELVQAEVGDDGNINAKGSAAWEAASDRLRLMLILKRIARQEGIDISEEDVEKRIKEKAAEFGTDPDSLKSELQKGGGTTRLKEMLLAESTLEYLMELNQQR